MRSHGNTKSNAEFEFLSEKAAEAKPKDERNSETVKEKMKEHAAFIHSKYVLKNFCEDSSGELCQWDDGVAESESTVGLIENMGVLMIKNMSAKELPRMDLPPFLSDPYLIFTLGPQEVRSETVVQDLNPTWSEMVNLNMQSTTQEIKIALWDEDFGRADVSPLLPSFRNYFDTVLTFCLS